jgi:hypothetical protein
MTAKLQDRGQGHPEKEYGQYADKIEEQWRLQCLQQMREKNEPTETESRQPMLNRLVSLLPC